MEKPSGGFVPSTSNRFTKTAVHTTSELKVASSEPGTIVVEPLATKQGPDVEKEIEPAVIDLDKYEEQVPESNEALNSKSLALVVREQEGVVQHEYPRSDLPSVSSPAQVAHSSDFNTGSNENGTVCQHDTTGIGHGMYTPQIVAAPRWASSHVGILTVQCARCLKWRVVPTKELYETIREHILEQPWVCEYTSKWRRDAHCDVPGDLNQDTEMLWAIDKPNLPSSPPGWVRKVIVRKDCSTKFADVYYTAPGGKLLRSMVEIQRYITEHPESVPDGTTMNQFSFAIPQPLPGVWEKKKRDCGRTTGSPSSSQGKGKKARKLPPLAKQLAQRRLHGVNPPSLPVAPPASIPTGPLVVQPLLPAGQAVCTMALSSTPPIPPPFMRNSYNRSSSLVGIPTQAAERADPQFNLRGTQTRPSTSTVGPKSRREKQQQQKSRLGAAASLSEDQKRVINL